MASKGANQNGREILADAGNRANLLTNQTSESASKNATTGKEASNSEKFTVDGALGKRLTRSGLATGSAPVNQAGQKRKSDEFAEPQQPKKRKTPAAKGSTATGGSKASGKDKATDISEISLPGEETGDVAIYDTCAEIRRKINAYLKKSGTSQAQLCRDLGSNLKSLYPTNVQGSQLARFLKMSGPTKGNTSTVYYAAYVFFEKMRIAEGKPKSKHRMEMEKVWPTGTDTERVSGHVWLGPNEGAYEDKYGQLNIQRFP